jgi:hypothetical protein
MRVGQFYGKLGRWFDSHPPPEPEIDADPDDLGKSIAFVSRDVTSVMFPPSGPSVGDGDDRGPVGAISSDSADGSGPKPRPTVA